jgi:cell division protein FtsQ
MRQAAVRPRQAERALVANPWIRQARVRRWLPNRVFITVTEREAIALVNVGAVFQTDREGALLPLSERSYIDLPLVTGMCDTVLDGTRRVKRESIVRFLSFRRTACRIDQGLFERISQIDFSVPDRIMIGLEGLSAVVEMGTGNTGRKVEQLSRLLARIREEGAEHPRTIDLCHNNLAYVR